MCGFYFRDGVLNDRENQTCKYENIYRGFLLNPPINANFRLVIKTQCEEKNDIKSQRKVILWAHLTDELVKWFKWHPSVHPSIHPSIHPSTWGAHFETIRPSPYSVGSWYISVNSHQKQKKKWFDLLSALLGRWANGWFWPRNISVTLYTLCCQV
jgi:hypothetical protein